MLTIFPQCNFSQEFPEILSENHIRYHCQSVSRISKTLHCGIVINMPYSTHKSCVVDAWGLLVRIWGVDWSPTPKDIPYFHYGHGTIRESFALQMWGRVFEACLQICS